MAPLLKFITGFAATSLLASGAYRLSRSPLLSDLGSRTAEVMVANGITDGRARWVTPTGWTVRVARLSGTADAATRTRTLQAVAALPGIEGALWEDERDIGAPTGGATGNAAVSAAAANDGDCQSQFDAITAGGKIVFGSSDATIAPASRRAIDAIAQAMQRCPALKIEIIAHTARPGAAAVNLALSQARAEAVVAALAARGIAAGRMQATGKGSSDPVDPATGAEANSRNARIEFQRGDASERQEPRS